ncbi:variant erythrocyte surface antigen-1 family protein [Babesia caballi]|uniref:Variant erythrocyte surface antigen-1 family protein n=1 Tax=Babesia caballi TaxID=5871 RepID=A0AAV4LTI3_BABCB|nr:variant erythrocyte surface antigen-1 family protein [Babesia caballi]
MVKGCPDVAMPTCLKEALELFGALSVSELKERVGEALEGRLMETLKVQEAPNNVFIKAHFDKVSSYLEELRASIVQTAGPNPYGNYAVLSVCSGDALCAQRCAYLIRTILPKLYTTLLFFLFQLEGDSGLGGGVWDGLDCISGPLNEWLTCHQGLPSSLGSSSESSPILLPSGYDNNLSTNDQPDLVTPLTNLISDYGGDDDACLQYLLLGLATVTDWSPCSVVTCLAVLRAACDESAEICREDIEKIHGLGPVLKTLLDRLELLAPKENESDKALLGGLCDGAIDSYSKHLKSTFNAHMMWLKRNLTPLIASLRSLKTDSEKWTQQGLKDAAISGPFGYGFSFGGKWENEWKEDVQSEISGAVSQLTDNLAELENILDEHFKTSRAIWTSESGSAVPVPQNLKQAIDWVLRVSGRDGVVQDQTVVQDLADEVNKLLYTDDLSCCKYGKSKLMSLITTFADGLKTFIGYSDGRKPGGKSGIASKQYRSSYEVSETWVPSWNSYSDTDTGAYAKIFLGCLPLIYYGVTYLYWRCANVNWCKSDWEAMTFNGEWERQSLHIERPPLTNFMEAVGYSDRVQLNGKSGDSVMSKLKGTFNELNIIPNTGDSMSSFYNYLDHLRQNFQTSMTYNPEIYPLYALYFVADSYWKSAVAHSSGISAIFEKIVKTLDTISQTKSGDSEALKQNIAELHQRLKFFLNPGSSQTSHEGPRSADISGTSGVSPQFQHLREQVPVSLPQSPHLRPAGSAKAEGSYFAKGEHGDAAPAGLQTAVEPPLGTVVQRTTEATGKARERVEEISLQQKVKEGEKFNQGVQSDVGQAGKESDELAQSPSQPTAFEIPQQVPYSFPAAPTAGTVAAVVAAGGAAAVYFNVGGSGTILKGLLGLH